MHTGEEKKMRFERKNPHSFFFQNIFFFFFFHGFYDFE